LPRRRVSRRQRRDQEDSERIAGEVDEMLDPYGERSLIIEGDQALVQPGRILENIQRRMERIDLAPDVEWAPEDLMSEEEAVAIFVHLDMGEMVVAETAWYARQIIARWPAELVEHPIVPKARIEMFLPGPRIDSADGDLARRVLNRALASAEHVETHPELVDLDARRLLAVWLALVLWFGIKSGLLHQHSSAH